MPENINTDPLVSILMAVYKPNYSWLIEQLMSLNNQSYSNIELIIYDDCPENPIDEKIIKKYITKFNYKLVRAKVNGGSNKAFEELTKIGQGNYFAYCDQDDIWEKDKLQILVDAINKYKSILAYSDMSVIDGEGIDRCESLLEAKPRLQYKYGKYLTPYFFFENCVSGCCMLIKSEIAKAAVPFSKFIVHDQWLCIVASLYGDISFIDKKLVKYRIHGNNQTGSLKNVDNKDDYYRIRVNTLEDRYKELDEVIFRINKDNSACVEYIKQTRVNNIKEFCEARIRRKIILIFKYRYLCRKEAWFEILIKYMPDFLVGFLIKTLK